MRRIEVAAHLGERAGAQLDEGRVGNGAHGADRGARHGGQAALAGLLALGGEHHRAGGRAEQAGGAHDGEHLEHGIPRRARRHHVGMRAHRGQDHADGDGDPRHALGQRAAVVGLAGHGEVRHGDHHEHHDRDELLRDAGGDVAEAVEDALPVLQVEEHGDAAGGQERAGQDRQQLLGLLARALERQRAGSAEHAAAPSGKGGEKDQGPLQFHYSSPFHSWLRRM